MSQSFRRLVSFRSVFVAIVSLNLLSSSAFAQAASGPAAPGWVQAVPLVFMVAIMYFLMIRPQQKREQARQSFVASLKRGDEIVTSSGMFGRVEGLTDQFVTLEVADGVRVKMLRSAISSSVQAITQAVQAADAKNAGAKGGK